MAYLYLAPFPRQSDLLAKIGEKFIPDLFL